MMKLFLEHLLLEDRVQTIRDKYFKLIFPFADKTLGAAKREHLAHDVAKHHVEVSIRNLLDNMWVADPTTNKMYYQWICQTFVNMSKNPQARYSQCADLYDEDKGEIREDLRTFDRVKARMPANMRDINRYKSYHELRDAVTPYMQTVSKAEEDREYVKKLYDSKQITLVYRGPEGKIEIPHTIESSQFLGRGTRWCTAATGSNYFDSYNKKGHLYVITCADGEKFQAHVQTNSFMNAQDFSVNFDRIKSTFLWAVHKIWASSGTTKDSLVDAIINDHYSSNFLSIVVTDQDLAKYWRTHPKLLEMYPKLFRDNLAEIEKALIPIFKKPYEFGIDHPHVPPHEVWSTQYPIFRETWPIYVRVSISNDTYMNVGTHPYKGYYLDMMRRDPSIRTPFYNKLSEANTRNLLRVIKPYLTDPKAYINLDSSSQYVMENYCIASNHLLNNLWSKYWSKIYHFCNDKLMSGRVTENQLQLGKSIIQVALKRMMQK